ncbi:Oxygen-dependent coproporphyrinogen-III oxidase [Acaryochloris thomasi RCC1774]|uniref:coproporphyrinogen oxidase n=1 Tax=Acaryochloris thomasi RCC1774 TaxID=1764569 RepID=A0A2W1JYW7_9CYAN|nr:coproporphyrinogen III oxidase [Acaryochloris thomasi]PZD75152.1 Oxygen-dependent coproporphyrinogen-III oxidase [Acaryochloris thomasi RCC1774]
MERTKAKSPEAIKAYALVETLQKRFVQKLESVSRSMGQEQPFEPREWFRDQGEYGGGVRYLATDEQTFNRASINISQVNYDRNPAKKLGSASAISTIVHPRNPHAPSVHMHISWTEMKSGKGYWRIMADLNPSIPNQDFKDRFAACLKEAAPEQYEEASAQGDRYFYIPALERHRGVTHFYLEDYSTDDPAADSALARTFGESVIDCYASILQEAVQEQANPNDYEQQLAYHSLYLFQVLMLDRGTTSGLLVHDQNDVGILGSLPEKVSRSLLTSWKQSLQSPQDQLLVSILDALPTEEPSPVDEPTKKRLANSVRLHYRAHPEALSMQARGNVIPPTVQNHG